MKRNTSQPILPVKKKRPIENTYDVYPSFPLVSGKIDVGYNALVHKIKNENIVILDGYIGVDWAEVNLSIAQRLKALGITVKAIDISGYMKSEGEIAGLVAPYLGREHSIFGRRTALSLSDYFDTEKLATIAIDESFDITIVYGTGASQCNMDCFLVYFDLPKNELQFRMRANTFANLGFSSIKDHKQMYKHLYFIDWVVLNKEKKRLLPKIAFVVDQQRPESPTCTSGDALRQSLSKMSESYFRVRPWFEPGVWGGQWMKERFLDLDRNVPNYAWSFEMIVPENGLVFENDGNLLEVSFDMLMYQEHANVLGKAAARFGDEFPIRFDFLDTFKGGNLSVQCHPDPDYMKKNFGENFTQDETYYILDAGANANVYLGFQENIDPEKFRKALENSLETKEVLNVEDYVQKLPAKKHDLFLIPHGTVHCSGTENMVLEISATPYIFTFKMYDWQRLDLDGKPRPMNIDHAFNNLDFERKGANVSKTLVSKPYTSDCGDGWAKVHLPTHKDHFYDIYRYEFDNDIEIETNGQCHILMLVEGTSIDLRANSSSPLLFRYAETFAVPAAANKYRLTNRGEKRAKVIVSFVRDEAC